MQRRRNASVSHDTRLSSRGLALSLSKGHPGRRRIYCSMKSSPCDSHITIPERQHVRPQRGTEAAGDASTPLNMTCVTTNTNRWQPGFRNPGQARINSPIEAAFRTSSTRISRFLDTSDTKHGREVLGMAGWTSRSTRSEGILPSMAVSRPRCAADRRATTRVATTKDSNRYVEVHARARLTVRLLPTRGGVAEAKPVPSALADSLSKGRRRLMRWGVYSACRPPSRWRPLIAVLVPRSAVTAEEPFDMPDGGGRCELVKGEIIRQTPNGAVHGVVTARIGYLSTPVLFSQKHRFKFGHYRLDGAWIRDGMRMSSY